MGIGVYSTQFFLGPVSALGFERSAQNDSSNIWVVRDIIVTPADIIDYYDIEIGWWYDYPSGPQTPFYFLQQAVLERNSIIQEMRVVQGLLSAASLYVANHSLIESVQVYIGGYSLSP